MLRQACMRWMVSVLVLVWRWGVDWNDCGAKSACPSVSACDRLQIDRPRVLSGDLPVYTSTLGCCNNGRKWSRLVEIRKKQKEP